MNLQHLKYAVEVEKTGSITQAAENLYMGQPNLSKAIQRAGGNVRRCHLQTHLQRRAAHCAGKGIFALCQEHSGSGRADGRSLPFRRRGAAAFFCGSASRQLYHACVCPVSRRIGSVPAAGHQFQRNQRYRRHSQCS